MTFTELSVDWDSWVSANLPSAVRSSFDRHEWLVLCPFHADRNPSCAVNTSKACFVCRSCGARGRLEQLRKKVGGSNPSVQTSAAVLRSRLDEAMNSLEAVVKYPRSWLSQFSPDDGYWQRVRGLLPSTIERYGLCIDVIRNHAIIPIWWQHELLGVVRRQLNYGAKPKYLYPAHLPKKEMLWGWDEAMATKPSKLVRTQALGINPVIVTEGQIDAISVAEVGARAVALGGNRLLSLQRLWLRRMSPTSVVVGLDNDEAGRGRPRTKDRGPSGVHQVAEMCKSWTSVYVVDWGDAKDPGEVRDQAERLELVRAAQPYRAWAAAQ